MRAPTGAISPLSPPTPLPHERTRSRRGCRACARFSGFPRPWPNRCPPPRPYNRYNYDRCARSPSIESTNSTTTTIPFIPRFSWRPPPNVPSTASVRLPMQGSLASPSPAGSFLVAPRYVPSLSATVRRLAARPPPILNKFDHVAPRIPQQGWTRDASSRNLTNDPALRVIQLSPVRATSYSNQPLYRGSPIVPQPVAQRSCVFPQTLPRPLPALHQPPTRTLSFLHPPLTKISSADRSRSIPQPITSRPSIALHHSPARSSLAISTRPRKSLFPRLKSDHRSPSPPNRRKSAARSSSPATSKPPLSKRCIPWDPKSNSIDVVIPGVSSSFLSQLPTKTTSLVAPPPSPSPNETQLTLSGKRRRRRRGKRKKAASARASAVSATAIKS